MVLRLEPVYGIEQIINSRSIRTLYQPLVHTHTGAIVGYEALSRGPQGSQCEMPDALFDTAHKCNMLWEVDFLCRSLAIERASDFGIKCSLFLNVDPRVLHDPKFRVGATADVLRRSSLSPNQIVFEVTEKEAIANYAMLCTVLGHYRHQGYRVAVDDIGTGYAGLRAITEIRPHFLKLDMSIIRDIASDVLKQEVVRCMQTLATVTGMTLVAEGVETKSEFVTLVNLGVLYVQGYLLGRPTEQLETIISRQAREIMCGPIPTELFTSADL